MGEQAVEERDVAVSPDGEMQVGDVAGRGSARIDHHYLHGAAAQPWRRQALVEHRMTPGHVGANEDHEIRKLQVLIACGHSVSAEGAAMAGN